MFGGDGTLNEVVQGLVKEDRVLSSDVQLIFLAAGSSCDFDKIFPQRARYVDRLLSTESRLIDLCRVDCRGFDGKPTSRYFVNNSSIGIISLANEKFCSVTGLSRMIKQLSVDAAAVTVGLSAIREFHGIRGVLKLDGEEFETDAFSNLTVFKTPYFGGGMNYGVKTEQDDGSLNVAIVDSVSRLRLLAMIPSLYTGKISTREGVYFDRCRSLEFLSDTEEVMIEVDGEFAGYPPARYSIFPRAIHVIV